MVQRIGSALHQPGPHATVDQLDGAVMTDEEVRGDLAHRRAIFFGMPTNDQQELVLGGGEPHVAGLAGAPLEKQAETVAELQ